MGFGMDSHLPAFQPVAPHAGRDSGVLPMELRAYVIIEWSYHQHATAHHLRGHWRM